MCELQLQYVGSPFLGSAPGNCLRSIDTAEKDQCAPLVSPIRVRVGVLVLISHSYKGRNPHGHQAVTYRSMKPML